MFSQTFYNIRSWKNVQGLQLEAFFQPGSLDHRRLAADDLPGPRHQPPGDWQLQYGGGEEAGRITGESEKLLII